MSVGEFCSRNVVVAGKDATVIQVAQLMRTHHVGAVIIIEELDGKRVPVGIVTDRDLVMEVIAKKIPAEVCVVGNIMTFELVTAKDTDEIWETLQRMRARGVRRVPVLDGLGSLVGIITADDLLELLGEELSDLVKVIAHQPERERTLRQ